MVYDMAFTRLTGFNLAVALRLYRELGGGRGVYDHRHDLRDVLPDASDRLIASLQDWTFPLECAKREQEFCERHGIQVLRHGREGYPRRLSECADAPVVLYYLGTADLNSLRVVDIVGTRRCTSYGQDLIRRFMSDLHAVCPDVLIVSGLAYGVDICAHRHALDNGYDTVGVLAHGLDELYPPLHRDTATLMLGRGGLLTEYMSGTGIDKLNFVRRNRIVAGISDATVVVESAAKGGSLITARIAQDYGRNVFAFPGAVGAVYSEGCNNLIRDNGAQLITSASDFVNFMGWQGDTHLSAARRNGIERHLFPPLSAEEKMVCEALAKEGDMHLNLLSVKTNIAAGTLQSLLFQMELNGVVRMLAGGSYHLLV